MKLHHAILAGLLVATTPALATDKPGGDTYNQTWDNSVTNNQSLKFLQRIEQKLSARAEANQAQSQGQGQAQSQTATGGNANNSNNVNVDNRTRINNAPTVIGNGDTYGGSAGVGGVVALAAVVPSRAHGAGKIVANFQAIGPNRKLMYTQCSIPGARATLELENIRCDYVRDRKWNELRAHEAQYAVKVAPKPRPASGKPRVHRTHKRGCGCK